MQLQPIRYEYRKDNALGLKSETENIGFGAQSLQKIIPEAVNKNSEGYLMVNNDPILWTMLNAIKEQQKEIAELKGQIRKLQASSRRHRK
jgi:Chaperone of endosialidase